MALLDWAGVRIEAAAPGSAEAQRWSQPQSALQRWVLPEFDMRLAIIRSQLA
jgi:hypothetical protein